MFKNHFKIAWRHLWRKRLFSTINVLGLILGFVSVFCISSYILYEKSYDLTNPDVESSYRLIASEENANQKDKSLTAINFLPIRDLIINKIPEIVEIVRLQYEYFTTVKIDNESFVEKDIVWADPSITKIADIRLLPGSSPLRFAEPNTVLLSMSEAIKLFGGTVEAIGRTFSAGVNDLTVVGVFKDLPGNNSFKSDIIASINTLPNLDDPWSHQGKIYIKLNKNADTEFVTKKMNQLITENLWWLTDPPQYSLQPVKDIHFYSNHISGTKDAVNLRDLYVFGIVSMLIIVCTAFNYMSLSLADFTERTKEFGVKTVLGSGRWQLVLQPLVEGVILYSFSVITAIIVSVALLPMINEIFSTEIDISFFFSLPNLMVLSAIFLVLLVLSVSYPLLQVSRSKSFSLFEKSYPVSNVHLTVRNLIIISQFIVVIGLIFALIVIQKQMYLIGKENLGFNKEQVVVLTSTQFGEVNTSVISQKINNLAGVSSTSVAMGSPLNSGLTSTFKHEDNYFDMSFFHVDEKYIETMEMQIVDGTALTAGDSTYVVVNEAMVKKMGWENAIGQKVAVYSKMKEVKGVVRDFQMRNIHFPANPVIIIINKHFNYSILVRLRTGRIEQTLEEIQKIWNDIAPAYPMRYHFLDEEFQAIFVSEIRIQRLIKLFSAIAIIIACLGLYGAVVHTAQRRVKEIGIRKTLGASTGKIVRMFSLSFLKLIIVAFLITVPIIWYFMNEWLSNFASRIEIKWWMALASGCMVAALAIFTIGFQSVKAAWANPVDSLRDE